MKAARTSAIAALLALGAFVSACGQREAGSAQPEAGPERTARLPIPPASDPSVPPASSAGGPPSAASGPPQVGPEAQRTLNQQQQSEQMPLPTQANDHSAVGLKK
jgi:hypothetical protein